MLQTCSNKQPCWFPTVRRNLLSSFQPFLYVYDISKKNVDDIHQCTICYFDIVAVGAFRIYLQQIINVVIYKWKGHMQTHSPGNKCSHSLIGVANILKVFMNIPINYQWYHFSIMDSLRVTRWLHLKRDGVTAVSTGSRWYAMGHTSTPFANNINLSNPATANITVSPAYSFCRPLLTHGPGAASHLGTCQARVSSAQFKDGIVSHERSHFPAVAWTPQNSWGYLSCQDCDRGHSRTLQG